MAVGPEEYRPESTNAFAVDFGTFPPPSTKPSPEYQCSDHLLFTNNDNQILERELDMHKLEAQIIISRQVMAAEQGDMSEHQEYLAVAGPLYDRHIAKNTRLTHINAKNKKPPILPITFSQIETSELYWVLVQFGTIDSVIAHVEQTFKDNRTKLWEGLPTAPQNLRTGIGKAIEDLDAALLEWRPSAMEAVNGRCFAMQDLIAAEMPPDEMNADDGGV